MYQNSHTATMPETRWPPLTETSAADDPSAQLRWHLYWKKAKGSGYNIPEKVWCLLLFTILFGRLYANFLGKKIGEFKKFLTRLIFTPIILHRFRWAVSQNVATTIAFIGEKFQIFPLLLLCAAPFRADPTFSLPNAPVGKSRVCAKLVFSATTKFPTKPF